LFYKLKLVRAIFPQFRFFSRLHVSSPYQKDDHSAIYRIINNSRLLPSLRDIVSCRRAVPLFVFAFLIFNWLTERRAEVCRLPLQCYRTKYSGKFILFYFFFFSVPKLKLSTPGLRASVVFVRQEKANKFKLNANTIILTRVAS